MKNTKKKIFFILPNLEQGGAERIIVTILNNINLEEFQPTLYLFEKKGYYLTLLNSNIPIETLNISRIRFSIFKILPIIRKEKPDIFFSGWGEISAFLSPFIPFFKHTKFISRETNVVSQHVTRKEIRFFYRFYNHFDAIICQSNDMRDDLIEHFNIKKEKITLINNPVDFDFIDKQLENSTQIPSFNSEFKNVVAIGNLTHRKGFDNLLHVFSHLKNQKIALHILGDGRDKEMLFELSKKLGLEHIYFHGQQKNPYQYLKFADVFVLSSRYEGFPNVLLESGACGTYALANHCKGGINEIIQPNINGEIADIENHNAFAERITKLISENHDKKAIRNSIESRFSKEIILEKYRKLFKVI